MEKFTGSLVKFNSPHLVNVRSKEEEMPTVDPDTEMMEFEECDTDERERYNILDTLLPPRKLREGGKIWVQTVSRTPATSGELLRLQESLDSELQLRGAREMGLCAVRRSLYDQCFEELVRQEAIVCPERGRLLQMVRREGNLSIESLGHAYESSLGYGLKKRVVAAAHVEKVTAEITTLSLRCSELDEKTKEVEPRMETVKKTVGEEEDMKRGQFVAVEKKLVEENELLLKKLQKCIDVSIDVES